MVDVYFRLLNDYIPYTLPVIALLYFVFLFTGYLDILIITIFRDAFIRNHTKSHRLNALSKYISDWYIR